MSNSTQGLFIFVAHTNLYAGNFEREMTAYATGQIGECEVGDEKARMFREDLEGNPIVNLFEEMISQEPDDNGCHRPAAIWPTPGRYNNGTGGHFDLKDFNPEESWQGKPWPAYESVAMFFTERPTNEMIELMKARCQEFAKLGLNNSSWSAHKEELKIIGFQLLCRKTEVVDTELSI